MSTLSSSSSPQSSSSRAELGFWESYFLGGAIASASRTVVAPIERIKLLMQCEGELIRQGRLIYTSGNTSIMSVNSAAAASEAFGTSAAIAAGGAAGREATAAQAAARAAATSAHNDGKLLVYKSIRQCFSHTIAAENSGGAVKALWRGNLSTVLRYFPAQATNFATNGSFKALTKYDRKERGFFQWFCGNVIAGGLAGTTTLAVVYSLEYTRTRMAVDIPSTARHKPNLKPLASPTYQFTSLRDCVLQTVKLDGIIGLYRGFAISMVTVFIKQGLYFGIFDSFRPLLPPVAKKSGSPMLQRIQQEEMNRTPLGRFYNLFPRAAVDSATFFLGWSSTFAANVISHPFDTIRRRVIATTCSPYKYKGAVDCYFKVTKAEGFRALWRGVGASALHSVAGGLSLMLFDKMRPVYLEAVKGGYCPSPTAASAAEGEQKP